MRIEMTGREDREGPWKVGVAGYPGAGKTMFASTAASPLFAFFQENPRLKSVADRHIPHVKVLNEQRAAGIITVQDKLNSLMINLQMGDHEYETLVVDTGDELFQAIKAGRRMKTGGEFGPADWGWLADTYREVVTGLIDLPMDVIFLYHLKSEHDGEDGHTIRNLALQGSSTDEAPGWFDIMGALDTFETTNEDGDSVTKRVILTHSSRTYPWVKDHSGALPSRFEISDGFVGDFPRMLEILHAGDDVAERAVLADIETVQTPVATDSDQDVPTPDKLQAKKAEGEQKEAEPESIDTEVAGETVQQGADLEAPPLPQDDESQAEPEESEAVAEQETIPTESDASLETDTEEQDGESDALAEAEQLAKEELGATAATFCDECGEEVDDMDVLDLAQIRFRKNLCRQHFTAAIQAARAS